jgi:hypothetical protein
MLTFFRFASLSLSHKSGSVFVAAYCIRKTAAAGSSGKAHSFVLTMIRLFTPCTWLFDLLENQNSLGDDEWEVILGVNELHLDTSTEELLSADGAFTFADLYAMIGNGDTVAWLTLDTAVTRGDGRGWQSWLNLDGRLYSRFNADGVEICAFARSHEHLF